MHLHARKVTQLDTIPYLKLHDCLHIYITSLLYSMVHFRLLFKWTRTRSYDTSIHKYIIDKNVLYTHIPIFYIIPVIRTNFIMYRLYQKISTLPTTTYST